MKRVKVTDEYGVDWTVTEKDSLFPRLAKADIETEDYSCLRDDFLAGFEQDGAQLLLTKLEETTHECLSAQRTDQGLLNRLLHISEAYTTRVAFDRTTGDSSTAPDH